MVFLGGLLSGSAVRHITKENNCQAEEIDHPLGEILRFCAHVLRLMRTATTFSARCAMFVTIKWTRG
jgi:hypothetical protein